MAKLKQNRIIIFDFNRTLYDPDDKMLLPRVRFVLNILRRRGWAMYLVSRASPTRQDLISKLGINRYFKKIIITKNKNLGDFASIVGQAPIDNSYVIGDRVREEIKFGNSLGCITIWLCSGKFARELPKTAEEKPDYIVKNLREILKIVR